MTIPCRCNEQGAQCMIHNPPFPFLVPTQDSWIEQKMKEFEQRFIVFNTRHQRCMRGEGEEVYSFISQTLSDYKSEVRKLIEGKKEKMFDWDFKEGDGDRKQAANNALSELLNDDLLK